MESVIGRQHPARRGRIRSIRSLEISGSGKAGVVSRSSGNRTSGILARIESDHNERKHGSDRNSWYRKRFRSVVASVSLKAFFRGAGEKISIPALPAGRVGVGDSPKKYRNPSKNLLSISFSPLEQGFLAGMLIFFFLSMLFLTAPQTERALKYSPFDTTVSLDGVSPPQAFSEKEERAASSADDRNVSAEAEELDVSRFQSLSFDTHEVEAGDTLSGIARRYDITLDTLVSFNQISDSRAVQIGTEFKIPSRSGLRHIVERGESVYSVAEKYSVSNEDILDVNDLETATLNVGDELFIPGARMRSTELRLILGELFISPTSGRMSSGFGTRPDPFTGRRSFHNGVDWSNIPGTKVVASMAGRVVEVGTNRIYGRYVIVEHPEGFQSMYGHLGSVDVSKGQRVSQRQRVGTMGNTGRSTGPHLHFSLFENGRPVDPLQHVH
ncbi:MAG: peptidoglycan DD-metalloendopeptidase family protein [Spirochaetales bacterium]